MVWKPKAFHVSPQNVLLLNTINTQHKNNLNKIFKYRNKSSQLNINEAETNAEAFFPHKERKEKPDF